MKQTRNQGCPRKNAPTRMGKVQNKIRNGKTWRAGEPLIIEQPIARIKESKTRGLKPQVKKFLGEQPKAYIDSLARHPVTIESWKADPRRKK